MFLSADGMVDASTALLPEHTWIYKDLPHNCYPDVVHTHMMKLLRYDGYATTETFDDLPQFMLCIGAIRGSKTANLCTAEPLTAENANVSTNTADTSSFLTVFRNLFRTFFAMLKDLFSGLTKR